MNLEEDNVIGIVGGMGPQSGTALFDRVLYHTKANKDQQHLSMILMSFPRHLVDRTAFLEGKSSINPAFNIVKIIRKLENTGAKIVGIACNTTHSPEIYNTILEELKKTNSRVKLLHMPSETCKYIKETNSDIQRVGLMTTNGTYRSKIYVKLLKDLGYEVIVPNYQFQNEVIHKMIYDPEFGIKANSNSITSEARLLLNKSLDFFQEKNADAIILGCTELSLILSGNIIKDMYIIDSIECLAKALIREATSHENKVSDKFEFAYRLGG
jgi:aspartate racemase